MRTEEVDRKLLTVKLLHTVVWAFFAGCIVAIHVFTFRDQIGVAGVLCGVVFVEVLVLLFNDWHCPMTPVAAKYTEDRWTIDPPGGSARRPTMELQFRFWARARGLSRPARVALAVVLSVAASACGGPKRIVAFGDVHGDLEATESALRLAGAIDDQDRWVGGHLTVVQTGDQLDRGDDDRAILDLFERLRVEASAAGGAFHALVGNHEIMNVRGDFRYVTDGGFADFAGDPDLDLDDERLAGFEPHQRGRMAAFLPGGPYARLLAKRDMILEVDGTVFVHGGVLPEHVAYGIDRINREAREWLRGETAFPEILVGPDSPEWTRLYSRAPDSLACETLTQVLSSLEAQRMVVGHTVQSAGIESVCEGRAWLIDTGMSTHYGGEVEVLEILGDSVRVLKAVRPAGVS